MFHQSGPRQDRTTTKQSALLSFTYNSKTSRSHHSLTTQTSLASTWPHQTRDPFQDRTACTAQRSIGSTYPHPGCEVFTIKLLILITQGKPDSTQGPLDLTCFHMSGNSRQDRSLCTAETADGSTRLNPPREDLAFTPSLFTTQNSLASTCLHQTRDTVKIARRVPPNGQSAPLSPTPDARSSGFNCNFRPPMA